MLKTVELLELTDADLVNIVGKNVAIRISPRNPQTPETDGDGEETPPTRSVVTAGELLELQFSADTGAAVASLFQGGQTPDEVRWDSDDFRADFTWVHTSSDGN